MAAADQEDPRYLAIIDRALLVLRDDGVAFPAIPPFALRRWERVHGTDDLFPAAWPRALEDTTVPARGAEPPIDDLRQAESRRLAQLHHGDRSNVIYAERRAEATIVAVIDGIDTSDGVRKRWDWYGLSAPDYRSFLRELGERLVTPSYWIHPDLQPYFPCRARSRDEMRIEAKAHAR